jgi:DNA-binding response OmpR family regulator
MHGVEAIHAIRGLKIGEQVPIIAFIADPVNLDRERVLEAGADDLLAKPIDKQYLFERLHALAKGRFVSHAQPEKIRRCRTLPRVFARRLCAGDHAVVDGGLGGGRRRTGVCCRA